MGILTVESIRSEIDEIKAWLSVRPSSTMDPSIEKVEAKLCRLSQLKLMLRTNKKTRPDTHMMEAQTNIK